MLRLLLSIVILTSILICALIYAKSTLLKRPDNSVSIIELGKTVNDVREMNKKRKITIKENEKLLEDLDENN